jgi:hypothetical protein
MKLKTNAFRFPATRVARAANVALSAGVPALVVTALLAAGASLCSAQGKSARLGAHHTQVRASSATQAAGAVPAASTTYAFTQINFPGAPNSSGFGINPGATASQQLLVGQYFNPLDTFAYGGFVVDVSSSDGVTRETYRPVNISGITDQGADGINDSGQTVGYYYDSANILHGYELSGGNFTTINVPFAGAVDTSAIGINNAGDIVGFWGIGGNASSGFELSGGIYTNIAYPGEPSTEPEDINELNDVVGYYLDASETSHGFLLRGGIYTTIDVPGAASTSVQGISDDGDIVGFYCPTSACTEELGFLLSKGVLSTISVPGAASTFLYDISNAGVIEGTYVDSAGISHGFIGIPQ